MITRLLSLALVVYVLGFALFGVTLGGVAPSEKTDAVVVLTGGKGRIERGAAVMGDGLAKRMLIAGADPIVRRADLADRLSKSDRKVLRCCTDLGSESVDTRSNAEEAGRWLAKNRFRSFRLVTSDWHMRRAGWEFERLLGDHYHIVEDAVQTRPSLLTLFGEYNKYLLRRLAVLVDM
jgi:uncharacterized SAM-binding protein YcdF (DUF218 family)